MKQRWKSDLEMTHFINGHGGGDLCRDVDSDTFVIDSVESLDELVDGSTYYLVNFYQYAVPNSITMNNILHRVLESQVSSTLVNAIGEGAHVHRNVKFTDEQTQKVLAELNRVIVHKGGEDVPDSEVYVMEYDLSPQIRDVNRLLDMVEVFRLHAPTSAHFRSVGKIVPVLGGKIWSEEVIRECEARSEIRALEGMGPILRIQHLSGNDFEVIY